MDLEGLGLHVPVLLAGFSGGVCFVALQEGQAPSLWTVLSGISIATLTANYLSQLASAYFWQGGNATAGLASAFIVGLCGPWICRGIIRKVRWNANGDSK